jgi:hypothetical protein
MKADWGSGGIAPFILHDYNTRHKRKECDRELTNCNNMKLQTEETVQDLC